MLLACSIWMRLLTAVCSCSVTISLCCRAWSYRMLMVATLAKGCARDSVDYSSYQGIPQLGIWGGGYRRRDRSRAGVGGVDDVGDPVGVDPRIRPGRGGAGGGAKVHDRATAR